MSDVLDFKTKRWIHVKDLIAGLAVGAFSADSEYPLKDRPYQVLPGFADVLNFLGSKVKEILGDDHAVEMTGYEIEDFYKANLSEHAAFRAWNEENTERPFVALGALIRNAVLYVVRDAARTENAKVGSADNKVIVADEACIYCNGSLTADSPQNKDLVELPVSQGFDKAYAHKRCVDSSNKSSMQSESLATHSTSLEHRFTYHPPTAIQVGRIKDIRVTALTLANKIHEFSPYSMERDIALNNIDAAVMWANAAIVRHS